MEEKNPKDWKEFAKIGGRARWESMSEADFKRFQAAGAKATKRRWEKFRADKAARPAAEAQNGKSSSSETGGVAGTGSGDPDAA